MPSLRADANASEACCLRTIIDTLVITNLRRGTETTVLVAVITDYRISLSLVLGECEPSRIWISDAGRLRGSDIDTVKHQTILTKQLTRQSKDRDNRFDDISIREFSVDPIILSFSFTALDDARGWLRFVLDRYVDNTLRAVWKCIDIAIQCPRLLK